MYIEQFEGSIAQVPWVNYRVLGKKKAEELRFVREAELRTALINTFLEEDEHGRNGIYHQMEPVKRRRSVLFEKLVVSSIEMKGIANLLRVRELQKEGRNLACTSAHRSDLDHTLLREGLEEEGFDDIASSLYFFAGVKMWTRPFTAFFMPGENALVVRTPSDAKDIDSMKARAIWNPGDLEVISRYEKCFNNLMEKSKERVRKLGDEGKIGVFYPESTRSRDGFLGRAPREVGAILGWNWKNTWVIPVSMDGIRNGMIPGKLPNLLNIARRRVHVSIVWGEPYPAREIWDHDLTTLGSKVREISVADYVMAKIAQLDWSIVRPEDRTMYEKILATPLKNPNKAAIG